MIYFRRKTFAQQQGQITPRDEAIEVSKLQRQQMMTQRMKYKLNEQKKVEDARRLQNAQKMAQREDDEQVKNALKARKLEKEDDAGVIGQMQSVKSKAKTTPPVSMKH